MAPAMISVVINKKELRNLRMKMGELEKKVAKKVTRQAISKAATPMNKAAKRMAPVGETGLLKKSIGRRAKTYGDAYVQVIGPRKGHGATVDGKKHDPANYAHLVEFGTSPHAMPKRRGAIMRFLGTTTFHVDHPGGTARPFLRPAFDMTKAQSETIFINELRKNIDGTWRKR